MNGKKETGDVFTSVVIGKTKIIIIGFSPVTALLKDDGTIDITNEFATTVDLSETQFQFIENKEVTIKDGILTTK